MREKKQYGFWVLGLLLLVGLLLSTGRYLALERKLREAEATRDREFYAVAAGQGDMERWHESYEKYWAAYHARYSGRHNNPELDMAVCGIGLFLWLLTLLGRGILRAAQWSVAREERRQRDRDPWEE